MLLAFACFANFLPQELAWNFLSMPALKQCDQIWKPEQFRSQRILVTEWQQMADWLQMAEWRGDSLFLGSERKGPTPLNAHSRLL
jgi:hypothetical protein